MDIINILTWCGIIGFIYLLVNVTSDDDWSNSKVYKDLNETILNRNEEI